MSKANRAERERRVRALCGKRAARLALSYFAFSIVYILFSDQILNAMVSDKDLRAAIQTYKGIGFVTATALLLYCFVRWHLGAVFRAQEEAMEARQQVDALNTELEERVEERTSQLQAVNNELRRFSHAVSHDLRAPLRAISGYANALKEDFGDKLDGEGLDYIERIRQAGKRSDDIVSSLLGLSRVAQVTMTFETVDVSKMAEDLFTDLRTREPHRNVETQVEAGLTVRGDGRLVGIIMQNFIYTAWKFTSREGVARIRVFGEDEYIVVQDNGIGFDPSNSERIFDEMDRLPGSETFPGMGIGLATVKRIVQRHRGSIWAKGKPGEGASFGFALSQSSDVAAEAVPEDTISRV